MTLVAGSGCCPRPLSSGQRLGACVKCSLYPEIRALRSVRNPSLISFSSDSQHQWCLLYSTVRRKIVLSERFVWTHGWVGSCRKEGELEKGVICGPGASVWGLSAALLLCDWTNPLGPWVPISRVRDWAGHRLLGFQLWQPVGRLLFKAFCSKAGPVNRVSGLWNTAVWERKIPSS